MNEVGDCGDDNVKDHDCGDGDADRQNRAVAAGFGVDECWVIMGRPTVERRLVSNQTMRFFFALQQRPSTVRETLG